MQKIAQMRQRFAAGDDDRFALAALQLLQRGRERRGQHRHAAIHLGIGHFRSAFPKHVRQMLATALAPHDEDALPGHGLHARIGQQGFAVELGVGHQIDAETGGFQRRRRGLADSGDASCWGLPAFQSNGMANGIGTDKNQPVPGFRRMQQAQGRIRMLDRANRQQWRQ